MCRGFRALADADAEDEVGDINEAGSLALADTATCLPTLADWPAILSSSEAERFRPSDDM